MLHMVVSAAVEDQPPIAGTFQASVLHHICSCPIVQSRSHGQIQVEESLYFLAHHTLDYFQILNYLIMSLGFK